MNFVKNSITCGLLFAGLTHLTPMAAAAMLEEVVVTAQKRAQSVNDIGVSANAFAGDQLKQLGVDSAVDLGAFTPGLITVNATSGGTPIFAIRGIGLDDFSPNNSSGVGVYTDEVFASNPAFLGGQLFDIERVEVLKGPQGTLYGKNTTGGAINFITQKPSEEFEAYVEAGYGRFDTLEVTGVVSGNLADGVNGRLATNYVDSDGWQKDVDTGKEYGTDERFAIRGLLDFELGDNGSAMLRANYSKDESTPLSPHVSGLGDFFGDPSFDALNSPTDPRDVTVGILDLDRDEEGTGLALTLNYDFENFDFISITAWDKYEREVTDNYGGSAAAILDFYQDNEMEQLSQEFRLVSNSSGRFSWVTGINLSNEEVTVIDTFDDSYLVTDSTNVTFEYDPADALVQGWDLLTADYVQETDSYGAYLHTETEIGDDFTLIVGLRYSYDDRSFKGKSTNTDAEGSFNDTITALDESNDDDAITGKIGLNWQLNDEILLYSSVSTSYKSGTYYGAAVLDDVSWAYIEPEDVLAYELGFKATLLDGSLQLNGAVFALDYEDRQSLITFVVDDFSNFLGFPVADTTLVNVPESESQGFELDLNWSPIDGLLIMAGVGYLDSEVTKAPTAADMRGINPDPSVNDQAAENGFGFVDALQGPLENGSVLSQAPEWSYNGMIAYEFPVTDGMNLRLQTSYSRVDSQVAQLADSNAQYDAVKSWDAQVSLSDEAAIWDVTLWAKNLTGNDADTYAFSSFAGRAAYRQKPETYGITLRYAFY
jgi:iron complex outermembrane receptor protein